MHWLTHITLACNTLHHVNIMITLRYINLHYFILTYLAFCWHAFTCITLVYSTLLDITLHWATALPCRWWGFIGRLWTECSGELGSADERCLPSTALHARWKRRCVRSRCRQTHGCSASTTRFCRNYTEIRSGELHLIRQFGSNTTQWLTCSLKRVWVGEWV